MDRSPLLPQHLVELLLPGLPQLYLVPRQHLHRPILQQQHRRLAPPPRRNSSRPYDRRGSGRSDLDCGSGMVGVALLVSSPCYHRPMFSWFLTLLDHDSHKPPVLKNMKHNSDYGKVERCEPQNWGENDLRQPQPTGTEGQNATGNTGTEQNQNGYDYDYDRNRLPKRAEDKIKEYLDQRRAVLLFHPDSQQSSAL